MYKRGKFIDRTKKYTYDEARKVAIQIAAEKNREICELIINLAIMAYIDLTKKPNTDEYLKLLDKYAKDYAQGMFSINDLKKYNRDSLNVKKIWGRFWKI